MAYLWTSLLAHYPLLYCQPCNLKELCAHSEVCWCLLSVEIIWKTCFCFSDWSFGIVSYEYPSLLAYYFCVYFETCTKCSPLYCIMLMLVNYDLWDCRKGCLLKNHFQLSYVVRLQTLIWPSGWQGLDSSRYYWLTVKFCSIVMIYSTHSIDLFTN